MKYDSKEVGAGVWLLKDDLINVINQNVDSCEKEILCDEFNGTW